MSQRHGGLPNILGVLRGTNLKVLGKAGAAAGAGLAGGTTSGAPTTGSFDVGEAVIGADGTLFLCTASGSPGTWVQLGTLVDPCTTRGDLIVRGASSTGRLALGANTYVLTSNGTDAVWGVAPAGAGGALTQIASTVLGASAANITFSSIPGTYSHLRLVAQLRGDKTATSVEVELQVNGDTGNNYTGENLYAWGTNQNRSLEFLSAAYARVGWCSAASAPSGAASPLVVDIPNYAGTTFRTEIVAQFGYSDADTTANTTAGGTFATWHNTSAVTSLKLFPNTNNFVSGSVVTLYGVS